MINILYEDNHLLVVEKPVNIPVQEDDSQDKDFLNMLKEYIKVKYNKPGDVYLGLVHRLDRPVGGVMVFAKTSKAASRLSEQIRTHKMEKIYYAVVKGYIDISKGQLVDFLLKDTSLNKVSVDERGKEAILDYEVVDYQKDLSLVKVNLITGRSHQIRVQFSSRNHPLYGDQKYGDDSIKDNIALFAYSLTFYHPITNEKMVFTLGLPKRYPFNLFKITI